MADKEKTPGKFTARLVVEIVKLTLTHYHIIGYRPPESSTGAEKYGGPEETDRHLQNLK